MVAVSNRSGDKSDRACEPAAKVSAIPSSLHVWHSTIAWKRKAVSCSCERVGSAVPCQLCLLDI